MSLDARRRTRRRARAPTARPAHERRGQRRLVGSTIRLRLGARPASPVAGSGRAKPPVMRRGEQDEAR